MTRPTRAGGDPALVTPDDAWAMQPADRTGGTSQYTIESGSGA